jgi:CheY-like chemotaxis protein
VKVVAISASTMAHQQQETLAAGFDDFLGKPFQFDQVCDCLARHLQIEFEYATPPAGSAAPDWGDVALPEDIRIGLLQAAEFYNVTDMEDYLKAMEGLGEDQQRLAAHLRELRQRHDMEAIIDLLGRIQT